MSEFGRKLKYLRERDQITITKLAQLTHYDKERLRDIEAGRAVPKDWEIQTIAEALKVKPEYFGKAEDGEAPALAPKAPPAGAAASPAPARKGLDFSEFKYFKDGERKPAAAEARRVESEGDEERRPLAPDLFEESTAVPPVAAPAARPQAPAAPRAPAQPQPAPPAPRPERAAAAAPGGPTANGARFAAIETLVYVKALCEVLHGRGLFTAEEFAKAIRRARGG